MRILFICHSLQIKSEWIFRLIVNLEENIVCIATNEPNLVRIKIRQKSLNPIFAKIVRVFNENINIEKTYPFILKKLEYKYSTNVNYIHFITFAQKVKSFVINSPNPTLIHCHGKDIMWNLVRKDTHENFHNQQYFEDLKIMSNKAFFLANSTFTKNQLLYIGIPENRIFINHFGIELPTIIEKPVRGKFKILYLGRLVDFKGPLEVISAFEKACSMGMDAELIIAGGGEMELECRERVKKSKYKNSIIFIGWVDKIEAEKLYREVDIFTAHNKIDKYTNQVEAFGVTIIEAMSYGLPVITGNSGGVQDSIIDNETGFLIKSLDINSHADKFLQLYKNEKLRLEMGAKARNRIKHSFSPQKEKENLKRIFDIVINDSNN